MPSIRDLSLEVGRSTARCRTIVQLLERQEIIPRRSYRGLYWYRDGYTAVVAAVRTYLEVHGRRGTATPDPRATHVGEIAITLGADPEFEVVDQYGNFAPANRFLRGGTRATVGTDGRSDTGELRPGPGTPEGVTATIKRLLKRVKKAIPENWDIRAGAGVVAPLGGHIHVGGLGHNARRDFLEALDIFIAEPLNAKSNGSLRASYGRLGITRPQPHGFEYRSPCSWLAHPDLTLGALTITNVLARAVATSGKIVPHSRAELIDQCTESEREAVVAFYRLLDSTERLEAIKVFRAWGIAGESTAPASSATPRVRTQRPTCRVQIARGDDNMRAIGRFRIRAFQPDWAVIGARQGRASSDVIFVPGGRYLGPRTIGPFSVESWEYGRKVGLSASLRERAQRDPRFRVALRRALATVFASMYIGEESNV